MSDTAFLDTIAGHYTSLMIAAAGRLDLWRLLTAGPASAADLAAATGTHAGSLNRLLRGLSCVGAVEQGAGGLFSACPDARTAPLAPPPAASTPLAAVPAAPAVPGGTPSVPLERVRTATDAFARILSPDGLLYSLRTGKPALEHVLGTDAFAYFAADPAISGRLHDVTAAATRGEAPAIVSGYDFSRARRIVDLGGGDGSLLAAILHAYGDAEGIVLDTPSGVEQATAHLSAQESLRGRWEAVAGDFFTAVPPDADLYILKSVLHDWDDDRAAGILRNCRSSLGPGGRVLIIESIVPDRAERSPAHLRVVMSDLTCLLLSDGGRERTEREFLSLLASAALQPLEVVALPPPSQFALIECGAG